MRIVGAEFEIMGNCQGGRAVRLQDQGECDSWCDYGPSRGTGWVGGQNRCRPAGEQWCLHWNVELESGDSHWSKLKPQSPIISETDASPATRLRVAWVERFPCIWQRTWGMEHDQDLTIPQRSPQGVSSRITSTGARLCLWSNEAAAWR